MSDALLQALVDKALDQPVAFQISRNGLRVIMGPATAGGYVVEVGRRGRVAEREAVDVAVQVHRLLERKGVSLAPEMLAYRGSDRSRCFVLAPREAVSA